MLCMEYLKAGSECESVSKNSNTLGSESAAVLVLSHSSFKRVKSCVVIF